MMKEHGSTKKILNELAKEPPSQQLNRDKELPFRDFKSDEWNEYSSKNTSVVITYLPEKPKDLNASSDHGPVLDEKHHVCSSKCEPILQIPSTGEQEDDTQYIEEKDKHSDKASGCCLLM